MLRAAAFDGAPPVACVPPVAVSPVRKDRLQEMSFRYERTNVFIGRFSALHAISAHYRLGRRAVVWSISLIVVDRIGSSQDYGISGSFCPRSEDELIVTSFLSLFLP